MSDTPEYKEAQDYPSSELVVTLAEYRKLERQRDAAVALNYAKAEIIDELADILNMPTGATDEEIGEAANEAIHQRDAYAETLREILAMDPDWNVIAKRHPELGNDINPVTGSTPKDHE